MKRALMLTGLLLVALPGMAHGASSSVTGSGGVYTLNDDSNQGNYYGVFADKSSGQWVIFDANGPVTTSGSSCIGRPFSGRQAVYCPAGTTLTVRANDGDDTVLFSVTATTISDPFNGRAKVYGGDGVDTLASGNGEDELYGEAGKDTLDGGAGKDKLDGGREDDQLHGGSGPDDLDGGDGYDTVNEKDRTERMAVSLNNVANDGAADPNEGDNWRDTIEAVITGRNKDTIVGADRQTNTQDNRAATIIGWGESDLIYPGKRAEDIYADGLSPSPGTEDKISYDIRQEPVSVSLNGAADDGTIQTDAVSSIAAVDGTDRTQAMADSKEHDNIANGFENVELGQKDDSYYGAHAYDIPQSELPVYETVNQRIRVFGNPGNDRFYPGSTAEDIHGEEGDSDLTSYILRQPSSQAFVRVNMSLDGVANDGQSLDGPHVTRTAADATLLFTAARIKLVRPVTVAEFGAIDAVDVKISQQTVRYRMTQGNYKTWVVRTGQQALDILRRVPELISSEGRGAGLKLQLRHLVVEFETKLVELKNVAPAVFGWAWAFTTDDPWSEQNERDNIYDDIEGLQGSNNAGDGAIDTGVDSQPVDTITGNDDDQVIYGSPGADDVDGKGGIDIIAGDLPSDPGADILSGGPGNDFLFGGGGPDVVIGGTGKDGVFASFLNSATDGSPDKLLCGNPLLPPDTNPDLLMDLGPFEDDVAIGDEAGDGDEISRICKGLSSAASVTEVTADTARGVLTITASPGQKNKLTLSKSGQNIVIDDAADVVAKGGCTQSGDKASCGGFGITKVVVDSGDLKDSIDVSKLTGVQTEIDAGDGPDKVTGSPGADTITAGPGKDKVKAKDGNDTIDGGTEADVLDGGNGSDTISYATRTAPVDVYLAQPSTKHNGTTSLSLNNFPTHGAGDLEGDTIKWAENAIGGSGADIIQGNQLDNTLEGGLGVDALSGGPGNDMIKAKDGVKDGSILCGDGQDTAELDRFGPIDPFTSCETLL